MTFMSSKGTFMRAKGMISSAGGGFLPTDFDNLDAWWRYNLDITVSGAGVSQWDDQSGNGRNLVQTTDTNRPSLESDGTILFDSVDNFMVTDPSSWSLVQPETVYFLGRQVTWTSGDYLYDGSSASFGRVIQNASSPDLLVNAGSSMTRNTELVVNEYHAFCVVWDGASSINVVDNGTEFTGDVGSNNLGGFTLGATGAGSANWSNIQVQEVAIYSVAHTAGERAQVINYLLGVSL